MSSVLGCLKEITETELENFPVGFIRSLFVFVFRFLFLFFVFCFLFFVPPIPLIFFALLFLSPSYWSNSRNSDPGSHIPEVRAI